MKPLSIILALYLSPDHSLTDPNQDFYANRPVEWIEDEPTLSEVEFEIIYRDALEKYDRTKGQRNDNR